MVDAKPREKLFAAVLAGFLGRASGLEDGKDVFLYGELAEDRLLLGKVTHAMARTLIHGHLSDILIAEKDLTAIRTHQPDDHVESGGLAGAVGSEKTDNLAFFDIDIHPIHNGAPIIDFHEALGVEERGFLGDIGTHFPPGDLKYQNISSLVLLGKVKTMLDEAGWKVGNVDMMIMAEQPRLKEYIPRMTQNIAKELGLSPGDISIKAGTNETMGFVGEGKGMAAQAVAMIEKKVG